MTYTLNETHDPALQSWVESANAPDTDFPIQNLPLGVFAVDEDELPCIGVAIGDQVLDLTAISEALWADNLTDVIADACALESLEMLMLWEPEVWSELRLRLSRLLRADSEERYLLESHLHPMSEVQMQLPTAIGDYTDFYCNLHHATNVGSMFRPDNPLLPNYKYVPIGYHGRASSIVISGTDIRRPNGQTAGDDNQPSFGPSKLLDYELEVALFVGQGNRLGEPISIEKAEEYMFGLCLLNDWSARDIQRWEYQPLGPFLAKSFATTISPWIVTMEALAPFRVPAAKRAEGDPQPLPYLFAETNEAQGGIDLQLEVLLSSQAMREQGIAPHKLSHGNFREMYWTFAQMLTHHASNGCNLRTGDLIASGTVSGPTKDARGCLLELTWRGTEAIELPTGERRAFLQDGDEVILRGYCERKGFRRIGFGECRGRVLPALS
ncbi:MAG TPA: fumarylacetoacetase [Blastocatellia bacterium]|nr:fumarylacetoacetase [Blastocatellia bacterium]